MCGSVTRPCTAPLSLWVSLSLAIDLHLGILLCVDGHVDGRVVCCANLRLKDMCNIILKYHDHKERIIWRTRVINLLPLLDAFALQEFAAK